ncbi:hypothetical protein [Daejeonella sp.]|uniref:hypothetical protein n=1 Tax=Daejeonella sp. TaxID=2805397 RepID=UPI0030BDDA3B
MTIKSYPDTLNLNYGTDADAIPEKNQNLTLRLFVSGNTVTIKKTYQYEDFALKYHSAGKSSISLTKVSDTLHLKDIRGKL